MNAGMENPGSTAFADWKRGIVSNGLDCKKLSYNLSLAASSSAAESSDGYSSSSSCFLFDTPGDDFKAEALVKNGLSSSHDGPAWLVLSLKAVAWPWEDGACDKRASSRSKAWRCSSEISSTCSSYVGDDNRCRLCAGDDDCERTSLFQYNRLHIL